MAELIVDTDVVSYLLKRDSRAGAYADYLIGRERAISFMTLAELDAWATGRRFDDRRRAELERYLGAFAVYWPDRALCTRWAEVTVRAREKGRPIATADAWIAATALEHGMPLVTHNLRHYEEVEGLRLVSLR